jgi:hypothetical protein
MDYLIGSLHNEGQGGCSKSVFHKIHLPPLCASISDADATPTFRGSVIVECQRFVRLQSFVTTNACDDPVFSSGACILIRNADGVRANVRQKHLSTIGRIGKAGEVQNA